MKDPNLFNTTRFNSLTDRSTYTKTYIFLKSAPIALAFFMTGCAHTEKYLHPEKTFSLDNLSTFKETRKLDNLPIYETCADITSIHSPVIWVPLIGPAIDVSMSSKNDVTSSNPLDNAIIFLPLIGPAISFSSTSPTTCTDKTFHQSTETIDPDKTVKAGIVNYVANIADQSCTLFLDRLSSSKDGLDFSKTALSDIGTSAAAGTAFVTPLGAAVISTASLLSNKGAENLAHTYFGGQLIPAIKNNIKSERQKYRANHIDNKQPDTIAKLIHIFDDYDKTCSVQNAIDSLNNQDSTPK